MGFLDGLFGAGGIDLSVLGLIPFLGALLIALEFLVNALAAFGLIFSQLV